MVYYPPHLQHLVRETGLGQAMISACRTDAGLAMDSNLLVLTRLRAGRSIGERAEDAQDTPSRGVDVQQLFKT